MAHPRRTIVAVAAGLAGVLGMAGVAAAAHGSSTRSSLKPTTESGHHHRQRGKASTTTLPGVSTSSEPEHATPEPGDDNGVDVTAPAVLKPSSDVTGEPEPGDDNGVDNTTTSVPDETSTTLPDETSTTLPDETTTSMPGIPNGMQTFTVSGGTVTVDVENGVLSLVSATPNPGFTVDKSEVESDRVEVEFKGADVDSRVRVRIEDGQLRVEDGDN
jgi:hypothetical protein